MLFTDTVGRTWRDWTHSCKCWSHHYTLYHHEQQHPSFWEVVRPCRVLKRVTSGNQNSPKSTEGADLNKEGSSNSPNRTCVFLCCWPQLSIKLKLLFLRNILKYHSLCRSPIQWVHTSTKGENTTILKQSFPVTGVCSFPSLHNLKTNTNMWHMLKQIKTPIYG